MKPYYVMNSAVIFQDRRPFSRLECPDGSYLEFDTREEADRRCAALNNAYELGEVGGAAVLRRAIHDAAKEMGMPCLARDPLDLLKDITESLKAQREMKKHLGESFDLSIEREALLKSENARLKENLSYLDACLAGSMKACDELRAENENLRSKLESYNRAHGTDTLRELYNELKQSTDRRLVQLRAQLKQQEAKTEEWKAGYDEMKVQLDCERRVADSERRQREAAQKAYVTVKDERDELRRLLNPIRERLRK